MQNATVVQADADDIERRRLRETAHTRTGRLKSMQAARRDAHSTTAANRRETKEQLVDISGRMHHSSDSEIGRANAELKLATFNRIDRSIRCKTKTCASLINQHQSVAKQIQNCNRRF
jgi:hypothetical protein